MNLEILQDSSERIHYQDPGIPIYTAYGDLRGLSNMAALCHWHEDVELLLAVRGYLCYKVNGQQIFIDQGCGIFVNSKQMHYGFSADGTDCEYICICFHPELLQGNKQLYEQYVLPVLAQGSLPYLLLDRKKQDHKALLDTVLAFYRQEKRDLHLLGRLYELWQGIYDLMEKESLVNADDGDLKPLKQMLGLIHSRYAEHVSLAQIAASGNVSRSKCCQLFKKYMGHSPNDYLTSYRLERAMELLRSTDQMVTEIAFSCGFNSASYFSEIFISKKGCTPTQYRKHIHWEKK